MTFEIIVRDKKETLKVELPQEIIEKIRILNRLSKKEFKKKENEIILKLILNSLDSLLYTMEHMMGNKQITRSKRKWELTEDHKIVIFLLSIITGGTIGGRFNGVLGTCMGGIAGAILSGLIFGRKKKGKKKSRSKQKKTQSRDLEKVRHKE